MCNIQPNVPYLPRNNKRSTYKNYGGTTGQSELYVYIYHVFCSMAVRPAGQVSHKSHANRYWKIQKKSAFILDIS